VTIQFSAPVSNAVLHLANIGGNGNYPASRKTNFTTGFDMTLFSKWNLTSGQSMVMLSGGETTNIMLDGNVIRNRFTPNGLGSRVSTRECGYNEIACSYDNGTGSGSFLVLGTYSTLTFNIDLGWALVNYGPSNPAGLGTMQQWVNSFDIPEGVSAQLSFYEEGPALPTTTTAPTTTVAPATTTVNSSTPVPLNLPETGNQNSLMSLLVATSLIAMGVLVRRRLRA
jgi:LPXTG-motif cell wall-anchored protein